MTSLFNKDDCVFLAKMRDGTASSKDPEFEVIALKAQVASLVAERRDLLDKVITIADNVRLRLSDQYQDRLDTRTTIMTGNTDWMRLEGAVRVVESLRKFKEASK